MNNPAATVTEPTLVKSGIERNRLPTRLYPIIDMVRANSTADDTDLEQLMVIVHTAWKDGQIPANLAMELEGLLRAVFRRNDHTLDLVVMLRESGFEVAQREVERIEAVRAAQAKAVNKKP